MHIASAVKASVQEESLMPLLSPKYDCYLQLFIELTVCFLLYHYFTLDLKEHLKPHLKLKNKLLSCVFIEEL